MKEEVVAHICKGMWAEGSCEQCKSCKGVSEDWRMFEDDIQARNDRIEEYWKNKKAKAHG